MKRIMSVGLICVILSALLVLPVQAAEPQAPDWVEAENYVTFADDPVYNGEKWKIIESFRADAMAGNPAPSSGDSRYEDWTIFYTAWNGMLTERTDFSTGEWFERGLIFMRYAANSDTGRDGASDAYRCFLNVKSALRKQGLDESSAAYRTALLWEIRARFLAWGPLSITEYPYLKYLEAIDLFIALRKVQPMTLAQLLDSPVMGAITPELRQKMANDITAIAGRVNVTIDGRALTISRVIANNREVQREVDPLVINGRTMVPIRLIAEPLGAVVEWVSETQSARLTRAGVQIDLPIGSTTGYRNGVPFTMETAPYVTQGRTMVPVRYVAEFFGQTVEWDAETRTAVIAEDKSIVGNSNLEAWALAMGAIHAERNSTEPTLFGTAHRMSNDITYINSGNSFLNATYEEKNRTASEYGRMILADSWNIEGRDALIETVCRMTYYGHNNSFLSDVAMIESLSDAEYQQLLKNAQGMDAYMFPYTKELGEKWGDKGILAWDLFRMSSLVQWGYVAGYITYPEALALLEPAASMLAETFDNWEEACENYCDGYNWWSRADVLGKNVWETERGIIYKELMEDDSTKVLFDNSLFTKGVKGVPGLSAETLYESVQTTGA